MGSLVICDSHSRRFTSFKHIGPLVKYNSFLNRFQTPFLFHCRTTETTNSTSSPGLMPCIWPRIQRSRQHRYKPGNQTLVLTPDLSRRHLPAQSHTSLSRLKHGAETMYPHRRLQRRRLLDICFE